MINKYSNSDKQVLSIVIIVIVINKWAYIRVGLYWGEGVIFGMRLALVHVVGLYTGRGLYSGGGAYIRNEVSVSTCGGLIYGEGLIFGGGAYIRRFTVPVFPIRTVLKLKRIKLKKKLHQRLRFGMHRAYSEKSDTYL